MSSDESDSDDSLFDWIDADNEQAIILAATLFAALAHFPPQDDRNQRYVTPGIGSRNQLAAMSILDDISDYFNPCRQQRMSKMNGF